MERPQNIFVFMTDFPTHTVVWEVFETGYSGMHEVPINNRDVMFEGADGKVYMSVWPMHASRTKAREYVDSMEDGPFFRYVVERF